MSLPILQHHPDPSTTDLVRLFNRTDLHWAQHLGEQTSLDFGTAIASPALSAANHIRDAFLPAALSPTDALAQAHSHFARLNTRCHHWIPNPSTPAAQTDPLVHHLLTTNHTLHPLDIYHLKKTPPTRLTEIPNIKIIPARASYRHVEQLAIQAGANPEEWLLHLDDPHWDALLALHNTTPAGFVGVLAVGDLGRIESLHVAQPFRRQGIARLLLLRALEICARSLFKHVFAAMEPSTPHAPALVQKFGFQKIAQQPRYQAPIP